MSDYQLQTSKSPRYKHLLQYIILLILLSGPALNSVVIPELQLYHIGVAFALFLYALVFAGRGLRLSKRVGYLIGVFIVFLGIQFINILIGVEYLDRAFLYVYYFSFSYICYVLALIAINGVGFESALRVIRVVTWFSLLWMLNELIFGFTVFGHPGSFLQYNVNSQIASMVLYTSIFLLIKDVFAYYLMVFLLVVLAFLSDAKIVVVCLFMQIVFSIFYLYTSVYVKISLVSLLLLGFSFILFIDSKVVEAINSATEMILDPSIAEEIVLSGNGSSVSLRAYALNEILNEYLNGNILRILFGFGAGQLNLIAEIDRFAIVMEHYSPHFFYLEVLHMYGLSFYVLWYITLSIGAGKYLDFRFILLIFPTLLAVTAASSAVYLIPFYVFAAYFARWNEAEVRQV